MGYRSDVAIAIQFETPEHLAAFKAAVKLSGVAADIEALEDFRDRDDRTINCYYADVKWYESFDDVKATHRLMEQAVDQEGSYCFVRIGEDYNDIEDRDGGDNPPYDLIQINRSVSLT